MAKEYTYQNGDNDEYKIEWDKMQFTIQSTDRDLNTNNAKSAVDHEIYVSYYGEQIGYLHFSEFHDVMAKDVHPSLPNKHYDELIYINNILVNHEFRGWGIGTKLYEQFGNLYKEQFSNWPVAQVFVNPVAEYTFRHSIEKGYISESAFVDELITRDYDESEKQQAKDLFDWLPNTEQKDFKEQLKRMKKEKNASVANSVDLRNIEYSVIRNNIYRKIVATLDGEEIGYFYFYIYTDNTLYVDEVEVNEEYQNYGIGTNLYKEFGKIYNEEFNGWPVGRFYLNPVAEYSFRKAVSLGWISETALNGDVKRHYTEEKNELWQDLRNKLPEDLKGPDKWAFRK